MNQAVHGQDRSPTYRVDQQRTAWREVGGEGVVLDLDSSVYFGLNRSAGPLWRRLLDGATRDQLAEVLLAAEPAPATSSQAEAEVSEFLAALDGAGLLCTDGRR